MPVGRQLGCAFIAGTRLVMPPRALQRSCEVIVGKREFGRELSSPLASFNGGIKSPEALQRRAQIDMSHRKSILKCDGAFKDFDRGNKIALRLDRDAEIKDDTSFGRCKLGCLPQARRGLAGLIFNQMKNASVAPGLHACGININQGIQGIARAVNVALGLPHARKPEQRLRRCAMNQHF